MIIAEAFDEIVRKVMAALGPMLQQEQPTRTSFENPEPSGARRIAGRSVHFADEVDFNKLQGQFLKRNPSWTRGHKPEYIFNLVKRADN